MVEKTNNSSTEDERILGLDLLRAIAVLWVVVIHGRQILLLAFPKFPKLGYVDPVDLFFVLSGFLIGRIILREIVSRDDVHPLRALRYFWMRRWLRTLPAYFAVLALAVGLSLVFARLPNDYDWRYLLFLQNMWTRHPEFMGNAWSLTIEEFFYLLFPVTVVLLLPLFGPRRRAAYLAAAALFVLAGPVVRFGIAELLEGKVAATNFDGWCRKFLPARLDAIAWGALGACASVSRPEMWRRLAVPCAVLGVVFYFIPWHFRPGYHALWAFHNSSTPVGTLLLLPLLTRLRSAPRWFSAPVHHISRISYSMYLVHFPLVMYPVVRVIRPSAERDVVLCYIGYYAVTFLLTYAIYHAAERPGLALRKKVSARWRAQQD